MDLEPVDKEREKLQEVKMIEVYKKATEFFKKAEAGNSRVSKYKAVLGNGTTKPRLRESASPFTRITAYNKNRK